MTRTNDTTNEAVVIQQRLLTLPEAARYLGCALWSIRELIWNGQLPYTRFGRRFQVDVEDLDELVEREKRHGSKPASRPRIRKPRKPVMTSPLNRRQHIGVGEQPAQDRSEPNEKELRETV